MELGDQKITVCPVMVLYTSTEATHAVGEILLTDVLARVTIGWTGTDGKMALESRTGGPVSTGCGG